MGYYILKLLVSALVIVAVSELGKRHSGLAALLASLPLTSILAITWLHIEGVKTAEIVALSQQIFWLVIPSLVLFLVLPFLLRNGMAFWLSLSLASVLTLLSYFLIVLILRRFGVSI